MKDDEFSFHFPELDLNIKDYESTSLESSTLEKIYEFLDNDIEQQNKLIFKLKKFECKLDSLQRQQKY